MVLTPFSFQFYYAISVLSLAVITCSKLAICLHINAINSFGRFRLATYILVIIIVVSNLSGFLAVIVQCKEPNPWLLSSQETCSSRPSIYMYNGVLNILTDASLAILPVAMVWNVQIRQADKYRVIALFSSRLL